MTTIIKKIIVVIGKKENAIAEKKKMIVTRVMISMMEDLAKTEIATDVVFAIFLETAVVGKTR